MKVSKIQKSKLEEHFPRRVAKTERLPVWIVEIKMPRRYVDEFSTEQVEAAEDAYVDMEDIPSAKALERPGRSH